MTSQPSWPLRLAQADRHVAEAERRVTDQEGVIERLRRGGRDTQQAERLLTNLQGLLGEFRTHRNRILHSGSST